MAKPKKSNNIKIYRVKSDSGEIKAYPKGRKRNNQPRIYRAYTFSWEEGDIEEKSFLERLQDATQVVIDEIDEAITEITDELALALGFTTNPGYAPLIDQAYQKVSTLNGKFYLNVSVQTDAGWKWYRSSVHESYDFQTKEEFEELALGTIESGEDYEEPRRLVDSNIKGPAVQVVVI